MESKLPHPELFYTFLAYIQDSGDAAFDLGEHLYQKMKETDINEVKDDSIDLTAFAFFSESMKEKGKFRIG